MRASVLAAVAAVAIVSCSPSPDGALGGASSDGGDVAGGSEESTSSWGPGGGADLPAGSQRPARDGPRGNDVGLSMLSEPLVFDGADVVVAVTDLTVYATGATLEVVVRGNEAAADRFEPGGPTAGPMELSPASSDSDRETDPGVLDVEVVFPQGQTARAVSMTDAPNRGVGAQNPALVLLEGAGRELSWEYEFWLWPLPQADDGTVEIVADWPEQDLDRARAELDAAALVAAGDHPLELWPRDDGGRDVRQQAVEDLQPRTPEVAQFPLGDDPPPPHRSQRARNGPPTTELGAGVPFEPVVVEGEHAAVAVTGMRVYRHGARVDLAVHSHPNAVNQQDGVRNLDDVATLALAYPDGRTARRVDPTEPHTGPHPQSSPDDPVLTSRGGSQRGLAWRAETWLWPLPDPGDEPLQLVIDWPEQGIDETRALNGLDGDAITAAAERAVPLWSTSQRSPQ